MYLYTVDVFHGGLWIDRLLVWALSRFAAEGKARLTSGHRDVCARLCVTAD